MKSLAWKILAAFGFLIIFCFLGANYFGGPTIWDDLLYLGQSQSTGPYAYILNRYFHIYAQKFFIFLTGDAILGARLFWSFIIGLTIIFIFFTSSMLSRNSRYLTGSFAVMFFLVQDLIFKWTGTTYADFTSMTMLTFLLFLYVISLDMKGTARVSMLLFLGIVFFFGVKSKESAVCAGILFLGLGDPRSKQPFLSFVKEIILVIAGMFIAQFLLILMDWAVLADPFFSIKPDSIRQLMSFNFVAPHPRNRMNWFAYLFASSLAAPLLFYFTALSRKSDGHLERRQLVIWLLPFSVIAFLTLTMIKGRWGVIPRYVCPAIPPVCILASLYFEKWETYFRVFFRRLASCFPLKFRGTAFFIIFCGVLGFSYLLCLLIELLTFYPPGTTRHFGWHVYDFNLAIVFPLVLMAIFVWHMLGKKWRILLIIPAIFLFAALTYLSLRGAFYSTYLKDQQRERLTVFEPFRVFANDIRHRDDILILYSGSFRKKYKMFARNGASTTWLYNIYFNKKLEDWNHATRKNINGVALSKINVFIYNHIFMTLQDWQKLNVESPELCKKLRDRYDLIKRSDFVLLREKEKKAKE